MTTTTFTRPRPPTSGSSVTTRDTTPSALGMVGSIVVTEDTSADGGASVDVSDAAFSWTGGGGRPIDPRTGRPFRVAPWVPAYPSNLLALVTEEPLSAYITAPATSTYAALLAALASKLGAWGWSQESSD